MSRGQCSFWMCCFKPVWHCRTSYPLCFDSIIPETLRVIFVQLSWISWCWLIIRSYDESVILQSCSQHRSKIINEDFILRGLASIRGASSRSHPAHYSIKEWVKNLEAVEALEAVSPAHLHPVASRWQCWVKNRLSSCNWILFSLCSPAAAWRFPWSNDYIPTSGFLKTSLQTLSGNLWLTLSPDQRLWGASGLIPPSSLLSSLHGVFVHTYAWLFFFVLHCIV